MGKQEEYARIKRERIMELVEKIGNIQTLGFIYDIVLDLAREDAERGSI